MDTATIAREFTDMCAAGDFAEAGDAFWADDVVSLEPMPGDMARVEGREAVARKGEWWFENNEVHGFEVEGPFVFEDQFAVRFQFGDEVPQRPIGQGSMLPLRAAEARATPPPCHAVCGRFRPSRPSIATSSSPGR